MKKLLLVDGNSMLFRAYYATAYGKPMTSSNGTPTNAIFGFASMIQKAIDTVQPDSILVAFDAGKHTFRHDLYADYKGGRKPAPESLVPQFPLVRDFLDAFHIRWVEKADIEADDLIGTASKLSAEYQTYILTSDKDMLQLADDTTTVLLMKKGITDMDEMTPEKIEEDYGIMPLQIIDLKGLMGDASDNYKGIQGVGEKTAVKLIHEYGSVEAVLDHAAEIKGVLGKHVQEGKENAVLSKNLATIRRDIPLDFTIEECAYEPDYVSLQKFLLSLDMRVLAKKYDERLAAEDTAAIVQKPSRERIRMDHVPAELLKSESAVFLDEDRQPYMTAEVNGIALSFENTDVYISLEDALRDASLIDYLKNENPYKTGYDIKRDYHLLEHAGMHISFHDDAMITASLADSTLTSTDKIMDAYDLHTGVNFTEVYGKASKATLFTDAEKQKEFGCQSAENIRVLLNETLPKIHEYGMDDLYRNIEMPLTEILYRMEKEGIICNREVLDGIAKSTFAKITAEQNEIYLEAGHEFNINSPKQLKEVLFDELGFPHKKKISTSADVLEELKEFHPIISHILTYRKLSKIYSTYAEGLKKYIQKDGRIHTVYNQCATQTGRLSSSEPNLQNISVRDEQGREIRKAFLPEKGCVLLSSDYHQIELRMLADMADEQGLIDAFKDGIDAHTKTAMDVFGVSRDEVTPQMRRQAKMVNFGVVYGISDFGLAERLGISRKEAGNFIHTYYEKYPGIRTYMDNVVSSCEKKGYVTTICGRRRDIPQIHDKNHQIKEFGKRAAMNAPIQGSAADLIKLAMIHIDKAMKNANVKSRMILQVHDELIFNVPEDEIELMKKLVDEGMTHAMELKVPLTSECAVGSDWYEAK